MVAIRSFCALRPVKGKEKQISSPPYDVVDEKQAGEIADSNPESFMHVIRPEVDLPAGTDTHSEAVYLKASENLQKMIMNGALVKEEEPCLYVYAQILENHYQSGIVACCSVDDYDSGAIKIHEKTRRDKEEDRTKHIMISSAQTGPVFLMHKNNNVIAALTENAFKTEALFNFTAPDGIQHIVYRIPPGECQDNLIKQFQNLSKLYVADGHHRSKSASRARAEKMKANPNHTGEEEYNYFLAVIFPASSLKILPYNRLVADLNGLEPGDFIEEIKKRFKIIETDNPVPAMKGSVGMYLQGKWYMLTDKPWTHHIEDPAKKLDCSLLQEFVLDPLLGIKDPRTDNRISFLGGVYGASDLKRRVDAGEAAVAFLMHPVSADDIINVADAGKTMPPKSTWFEPKLRSGLFVHEI